MKRLIVLAIGLIAMNVFASCDRTITVNDLPKNAQQFISAYFPGIETLSVKFEDGEYEVVLSNGTEVEFSRKGEWKDVDCHTLPVPAGIIPTAIASYVLEKFPNNFIVKIAKERNQYEVELNNDMDLVFDQNGNFLHVD